MYPESSCDGYKLDHRRQYPKGTQFVLSNLTPRSTRRGDGYEKVVYFGGQWFIKQHLIKEWNEEFFQKPVEEVLHRFTRLISAYRGSA